jgi:hypothetical protein
MDYPRGKTFFGMRIPILLQRQKARMVRDKIMQWRPLHVILSLGRCFDADVNEIIRRIF